MRNETETQAESKLITDRIELLTKFNEAVEYWSHKGDSNEATKRAKEIKSYINRNLIAVLIW